MEFYLFFYFKFAKYEVSRMNGARFSMNFSMIFFFLQGKRRKRGFMDDGDAGASDSCDYDLKYLVGTY